MAPSTAQSPGRRCRAGLWGWGPAWGLYKQLAGQTSSPGHTECDDSCPPGSHCFYGICFCDSDTELSPDPEVPDLEASSDTGEAGRNLSSMLGPLQILSVVPGGNLGQCGRKGAGSNGTGETWESEDSWGS